MRNILKLILFAVFFITACILTTCAPKPECFDCDDYRQSEMFSPPKLTGTANGTAIRYDWGSVSGAKYEIELYDAKDAETGILSGLVSSALIDSVVDVKTGRVATEYRFMNLQPDMLYYARIRSIHVRGEISNSKWAEAAVVRTQTENVIANHVTFGVDYLYVTWTVDNAYSIILTSGDDMLINYRVTDDDKAYSESGESMGAKVFCDLSANTEYTIQLMCLRGIVDNTVETYQRGYVTGRTLSENILSAGDIGIDHLTLTWDNSRRNYCDYSRPTPDRIEYYEADVLVTKPLSGISYTDYIGQFVVTGLIPESDYTFTIHYGDRVRGMVTARTLTDYLAKVFLTSEEEDIGDTFVVLKWNTGVNDVTKIIVSSTIPGEKDITVNLSAEDISNHQKEIEELKPETTYLFRIYNGDIFREEITVTTLSFIYESD